MPLDRLLSGGNLDTIGFLSRPYEVISRLAEVPFHPDNKVYSLGLCSVYCPESAVFTVKQSNGLSVKDTLGKAVDDAHCHSALIGTEFTEFGIDNAFGFSIDKKF